MAVIARRLDSDYLSKKALPVFLQKLLSLKSHDDWIYSKRWNT